MQPWWKEMQVDPGRFSTNVGSSPAVTMPGLGKMMQNPGQKFAKPPFETLKNISKGNIKLGSKEAFMKGSMDAPIPLDQAAKINPGDLGKMGGGGLDTKALGGYLTLAQLGMNFFNRRRR